MPLEWPGEFQITSAPVIAARHRHRWLCDRRQPPRRGATRHGARLRCANRASALVVRSAGAWRHHRGPCQCLGADVGGRGARPGVPADVFAEPGFLGRQAARQQRLRQFGRGAARRDRRAGLVVSDRASRCLGLRFAGAADAGADRHRGGPARRRDPADQAGICVRARPRYRQAGVAGGGTRGAARRRRRRAALADTAVSDPRAAAAVAADFGRRCVRPGSVLGAQCLPRAGRLGAQRGPLHAAVDAGHRRCFR